jgi:mRNA interferase RelE/StbE
VYKITYTTQAAKTLLKMPRQMANLIREKLAQLVVDPYASNLDVKKLHGRAGYRLRVGDWRVIYEIYEAEVVIMVMKIAPRGEVYK